MRKCFLESQAVHNLILNMFSATPSIEEILQDTARDIFDLETYYRAAAASNFITLMAKAKMGKDLGSIYRISSDFAKELLNVSLRDATSEHLPQLKSSIIVEFPDDLELGEAHARVRAVLVGVSRQAGVYPFFLICEDYDGKAFMVPIGAPATKHDDLSGFIKKAFTDQQQKLGQFIYNCLLYINSGDPDLRDYNPPQKPDNFKGRDRTWRRSIKDQSAFNAILVGFGYKKPNLRHIDETLVRGHFRWQPYGTGMTQIKLIWIEAHKRSFSSHSDTL